MSRDNITFAVHTLLRELRQMKDEGISTLNLKDDTLQELRDEAGKYAVAPSPIARQPVPPAPTPSPAPAAAPSPQFTPPPAAEIAPAAPPPPQPTQTPPTPAPQPPPKTVPDSIAASGDLTPPTVELPDGTKQEQMDWLRDKVLNCPTCVSNKNPGRHLAFGVGNLDADIFLCGEAPGEEEEKQGEPFVGPAGQKLTGMLKGMGLAREDVYIGNILKWRPRTETGLGNRAPSPQEMDFSLPYLNAQISIIQPKVLIALGNTAIRGLLGHDESLKVGKIHGTWYEYKGIPLMPTFHPSYILHNETKRTKRMVWEDLLKVMEKLELPISDKQRNFFL